MALKECPVELVALAVVVLIMEMAQSILVEAVVELDQMLVEMLDLELSS